ncbi:MAG: HAD family hydrolase, partial [Patescibacteria group bacterium]
IWPLRLNRLLDHYQITGADAQMVVYRNDDGYRPRSNVEVDAKGFVCDYAKGRLSRNASGVDAGFIIMKRKLVEDLVTSENVSLEATLYPKLVAQGRLSAYETRHRYYSISSIERLPQVEAFLAAQRTVLLDRDGVLNERMPKARYVCSWDEWRWLPGAKEALRDFVQAGFRVVVITNQPGVARGSLTAARLQEIHERMRQDALAWGGRIDSVYSCLHNWQEGCDCRKPKPGLLFKAQRELALDLTRTYYIGDDERDRSAAEAAGCPYLHVDVGGSLMDHCRNIVTQGMEVSRI